MRKTALLFIFSIITLVANGTLAQGNFRERSHDKFPLIVSIPSGWEVKEGVDRLDPQQPVERWTILPVGSNIKSAGISSVSVAFCPRPYNRASSGFPGARLVDGHNLTIEVAGQKRSVLSEDMDRYWTVDITEPEIFVGVQARIWKPEDRKIIEEILKRMQVGADSKEKGLKAAE